MLYILTSRKGKVEYGATNMTKYDNPTLTYNYSTGVGNESLGYKSSSITVKSKMSHECLYRNVLNSIKTMAPSSSKAMHTLTLGTLLAISSPIATHN